MKESVTEGPDRWAIASAVRTKRPAPMMAPIPSETNDQGPSVRLRGVSALCARRRSIDFVRNNVLATICSPFLIDFRSDSPACNGFFLRIPQKPGDYTRDTPDCLTGSPKPRLPTGPPPRLPFPDS